MAALALWQQNTHFRHCSSKAVSYTFEAGEKSKNLDTIEDFYEKLIKEHFDRNDVIAALGGGVTGSRYFISLISPCFTISPKPE